MANNSNTRELLYDKQPAIFMWTEKLNPTQPSAKKVVTMNGFDLSSKQKTHKNNASTSIQCYSLRFTISFLVHRWFPLLFFSLLFLTLLTKERGTCLCVFVLCRHCDTRRVWLDHCCAIVIVTVCRYSKAIPSFFILTLLSSSAIQTHERASLFEKRATSRSPRVKIYVRVCVSMSVDNSYFSFAFMKRATEPYFSPPFMSNSNTLFPGWRS